MNLEQSFCRKGVWGEMTIVICHNCHFLVERCLDTPADTLQAHKGTGVLHKGTGVLCALPPDSNAYYTVQGISTSIKYGGRWYFLSMAARRREKDDKYDK